MVMHLSIASPEVTPPPWRPWGIWQLRFARGRGILPWGGFRGWGTLTVDSLCCDLRALPSLIQWTELYHVPDVACPRVGLFDHFLSPRGGVFGWIWPPPWSNPHHLPGGGGYPGACNWWCITRPSCDVTGQWSVSNCKTRLPIASVHSSKFDRKRHWMQRSGLSQPFVLFWSSYLGCLACVSMTVDTVLFAEQKRAWLPFSEEKCQRTVFHCNGLYWWTLGFAIETQTKGWKKKQQFLICFWKERIRWRPIFLISGIVIQQRINTEKISHFVGRNRTGLSYVKVSRDTFNFPWTRKFSFFCL